MKVSELTPVVVKERQILFFNNLIHCVSVADPDVQVGSVEWHKRSGVFAISMGGRFVYASNGLNFIKRELEKIFVEHEMVFEDER